MDHEEELTNVFNDLRISVLTKAAIISNRSESPVASAESINNLEVNNHEGKKNELSDKYNESYSSLCSTPLKTSTVISEMNEPKFNLANESFANKEQRYGNVMFGKVNVNAPSVDEGTPENFFTSQKLLHLCDLQRYLTVEKVMMERIQNMHETDKLIHNGLESLKQARQREANAKWLQLEQKILDDIHQQEINRPKKEAQLAENKLRNSQLVLERIQKVRDAENEARKKLEAVLLAKKQSEKMATYQNEFHQQYKDIMALINSYKNKNILIKKINNVMNDLKNCSNECENLCRKRKEMDVTDEDVHQLVKLLEIIKEIPKIINKEIKAIDLDLEKEQEEKEKAEVKKSEEEVVSDSNKILEESGFSDCFDSKSLQVYLNLKQYLENHEKECSNLTNDNSLKAFRFSCQKAVNIPVNAISPVSSSHLYDKYLKLHNLLSGKIVDVGGVKVSASQHPNGIAFCRQLLAKKFVRQGDLTVSSKPETAFAIATVLASLWVDFPDFGQLVLAYFQKACPYLAPVFMPQLEGQSNQEYHISLGYQYSQTGEVEKQDSFLRRMSGIMRLYAAVLISKVRQPGKQNPLGLSEGWRWMSSLLNLEPRPDICATLLLNFLEVAGHEMFRLYGTQFKKLLAYICHSYFPKLEKITPASSGGPIARLESFLQKIMKKEFIPPPDGLLPSNFW